MTRMLLIGKEKSSFG